MSFEEQADRDRGRCRQVTLGTSMNACIRHFAILVALATTTALAQPTTTPPAAPVVPPSASVESEALAQKRTMVERILRDSPVATRIDGSANADAKRHLAQARELREQADALIAGGRAVAADALLNEAMRQIDRARQLVPDAVTRAIEERARHRQLLESIASLQNSYQLNVERELAAGRKDATADSDMARAVAMVEEAKNLATAERVAEANRTLDAALELMLRDFQVHLGGQVLIYSRTFPQPQDEYAFELERNRSYESLVPIAITEFRPGKDARALIDRYVKQNRALRERAERQAAAKSLKAAVTLLQDGTEVLQRALQAAGLNVPQTLGQQ